MRPSLILAVMLAFLLPTLPAGAQPPAITLVDAVRLTLEHNPSVMIQPELVREKEGLLQTATGQFDLVAIAGANKGTNRVPLSTAQQLSRYSTYRVRQDTFREDVDSYYMGLNQQLRNGVLVSPLISAQSLQNNYDQYDLVNYSEASLTISVPLLKGLGERATGGGELAARSNLLAQRLLAKHQIARQVLQTISSFWSLMAAEHLLQTAVEARQRADDFYQMLERLIKGGELPPNLSTQALAKLLSRDAELANTQLSVFQQRQNLGLVLGLSPQELVDTPRPAGSLPQVEAPEVWQRLDREALVQEALRARLDYQSLRNDLEAAGILVAQADNFTKPDLKLSLKGGYAGLSETSAFDAHYSSLTDELRGVNFQTALVLELPIENNAARGDLLRRRAIEAQTRLRLSELANSIASEVLVALEAVRRAEQEYQLAGRSAKKYQAAVEVANMRFQQGEGSINDVLDLEDKYSGALGTQTNAWQRYAVATARLHYATGTLLGEKDGALVFDPRRLARVPQAGAGQRP